MSSLINYFTWRKAREEGEDTTTFEDMRQVSAEQNVSEQKQNLPHRQPSILTTKKLTTNEGHERDATMVYEDQFRKENEIM